MMATEKRKRSEMLRVCHKKLLRGLPKNPRKKPFFIVYKPLALEWWHLAVWNRRKKQHQVAIEASSEEEILLWLDMQGVLENCIGRGLESAR